MRLFLLQQFSVLGLCFCMVTLSIPAFAQAQEPSRDVSLYKQGLNKRDARRHASAGELFERAYLAKPRAIYLHEAAKSHAYGDKLAWALTLAQCASVQKQSPLKGEDLTQNKALIGALRKSSPGAFQTPKQLSKSCPKLATDKRMASGRNLSNTFTDASGARHEVVRGSGEGFGRIGGLWLANSSTANTRKAKKAFVTFKVGVAKYEGPCDSENVRRVTRARQKALRYCYEKQSRKNPKLKGDVTLVWTISTEGKVPKVTATKSIMKNEKVSHCMGRVIKRARYKAPPKACTVTQTFSLGSQK